MSFEEKYIYRIYLENKLINSHGDEFQQLFYRIMSESYNNFQKIENQGAKGDKKCDGYLKGEGIFFQVYGPKDYDSIASIQKNAIDKSENDLVKLLNNIKDGYWEKLIKYIFVFKSHRGSYPDLNKKCCELEKKYSIETAIYDIDNLLSIFTKLSVEQMASVANTYIPTPDFTKVNYDIMGKLIKHLNTIATTNNIDITKTPPDFDDKIKFNNICPFYSSNLTSASYYIDKLDDYLSSYADPDISDYLCGILKILYSDSQKEFPENSDLQFKYILDNCHSNISDSNLIKIYETNSYIIMAKYFETCDIFEEPPKK